MSYSEKCDTFDWTKKQKVRNYFINWNDEKNNINGYLFKYYQIVARYEQVVITELCA